MEHIITESQFKVLVKAMWAVYPKATFIPDEDAFKVWYKLLCDIPYDAMANAVQAHMQTNKFPPTIADIRKQAQRFIVQDEEMYKSEGWAAGLVMKAARNSTYGAEEEFAKLPPLVQEAVGSVEALRSLGTLAPDVLASVAKGQFLASYRAVINNHSEQQRFSPYLKQQVEMIRRMALSEEAPAQPASVATKQQTTPLLLREKVSFQSLPEKREEDSAAAASIRAAMQRRIQQEKEEDARREEEAQAKAKAEAERIKLTSDEAYEQFVEYAKGKLDSLPSKEELIGFYGLKATADFEQVLALVKSFHKA